MQPNIVFLLFDAARVSNLSCYGSRRNTTPFLNELSGDTVRFNNAYSNSIYSLPSYASIFTGEYPTQHGAIDWNDSISENILIRELNEKGYETHAVSTHLVSDQFGIGDEFDNVDQIFINSHQLPYEGDEVMRSMQERGRKKVGIPNAKNTHSSFGSSSTIRHTRRS